MWIAVGIHELPGDQDTLAIQDESARGHKVYNTYVVIDGQGRTVQSYRKVNSLFLPRQMQQGSKQT